MCGIIGYVGMEHAAPILLEGLSNLEYRGYDSAGVSIFQDGVIRTVKAKGRLKDLAGNVEAQATPLTGCCGIGHTRWATHGEPSERNSHPHNTPEISLVHNGIIENYMQLKEFLLEKGYAFQSETDTEVAAGMVDYYYEGDPFEAITKALSRIEGSFAFGVLFADFPEKIFAVRKDSPLIVGLGDGENYIASDIPAILFRTRKYYLLDELEIAEVTSNSVTIRNLDGDPLDKEIMTANWDVDAAQKGGYDHFMLKEIHEQPKALLDTVLPRIRDSLPCFARDGLPEGYFAKYRKIHFVACGTASHAALVGKTLIESLARIPVEVDLASEFRYRNPILQDDCLVVAISQSGETADTLAALRLAKSLGKDTLAIVNVLGSSVSREADYVLHTYAGPEISVASTKAYSVQISLMYLMALALAQGHRTITEEALRNSVQQFIATIHATKDALSYDEHLKALAPRFVNTTDLFYLGRGLDYALALEGSLKLKEISYIHSEAYAAGELKHGTISLITEGVPVIALVTQESLVPKIVSNIKEVRARGGSVLLITKDSFEIDHDIYDEIVQLPDVDDLFMPLLAVIILQLIAYHVAVIRNCDVDKPRNLAKSVTVE